MNNNFVLGYIFTGYLIGTGLTLFVATSISTPTKKILNQKPLELENKIYRCREVEVKE